MAPRNAEILQLPAGERAVDVQTASEYMLALTESGSVYSWGLNTHHTVQVRLYHYSDHLHACICTLADFCVGISKRQHGVQKHCQPTNHVKWYDIRC